MARKIPLSGLQSNGSAWRFPSGETLVIEVTRHPLKEGSPDVCIQIDGALIDARSREVQHQFAPIEYVLGASQLETGRRTVKDAIEQGTAQMVRSAETFIAAQASSSLMALPETPAPGVANLPRAVIPRRMT